MKEKFCVSGMTCSACSSGIERTVQKLNGVQSAEVSLMDERMVVEYDDEQLTKQDIMDAVLRLGYGISDYDENVFNERKPQPDKLKKRFLYSLAFLLPLMYFSMGGMIGLPQPHVKVSAILQMLFTLRDYN